MKFLKSKDFSIISCKASISSLCFIWTDAILLAMAKITALTIKLCMAGSIMDDSI